MSDMSHIRSLWASVFAGTVFALSLSAMPSPAFAACTGPAGVAGEIIYNADYNAVQFCNNTDWMALGSSGVVGGGGGTGASNMSELNDVSLSGLANGNILQYNTSTSKWEAVAAGAAVAGADTQVQFNDGGSTLAGATQLLWDKTNNRLTLGTTTPGSDTLSVTGTASVSGATTLSNTLGVTGDATFDTNTLFVDAANNRVGIGTTTPASALHVTGDVHLTDQIHPAIYYEESDNTDLGWSTVADGRTWSIRLNNTSPYPLAIQEDKDVIFNAGNVGIGTTTPEQKLHISGGSGQITSADGWFLRLESPNAASGKRKWAILDNNENGIFSIKPRNDDWGNAGDTRAFFIDHLTGNVGLGVIPDSVVKLDVEATSAATSGSPTATFSQITATPTAISSASYRGAFNSVELNGSVNVTGSALGAYNYINNNNTATVTAANGGYNQAVQSANGTVTYLRGGYNVARNNSASGTVTNAQGSINQSINDSTAGGTVNSGYGALNQYYESSISGATTSGYGAYNASYLNDGGDMTNAYGSYNYVNITSTGTGNITHGYAVRANITDAGAGTITNGYGLYIDDIGATNDWGVYQVDSSDTNYFAGNVGIGETSPATKLEVSGDIRIHDTSYAQLQWFNDANSVDINDYWIAEYNNNGSLKFVRRDNSAAVWEKNFVLTADKKAGIGTTAPATELEVVGTTTTNAINISNTNATYGNPIKIIGAGGSEDDIAVYSYGNNVSAPALFTYKARGTEASPSAVLSGDFLTYIVGRGHDGSGWAGGGLYQRAEANFSGTVNDTYWYFTNAYDATNKTTLKIASTGITTVYGTSTCVIGSGTGTTSCTSDRRLKTDIKPLQGALDKITALEGVNFKWKTDPSLVRIGLIAQDVEKQFPEVVSTDPETGMKSVAYASLVAPLVEAVKQLKTMFDDLSGKVVDVVADMAGLNDRVSALEAENAALKTQMDAMKADIEALKAARP